MQNTKPTIDQILTNLTNEVLFGKAYLTIGTGLSVTDPVVLNTARTFFGLTHEACLHMSQMFAAKLYDKTGGTVTVRSLMKAAEAQAGTFKHGTRQDVAAAIKETGERIAALLPILKSIQDRRNEALAHLDPQTVANPTALDTKAKLTLKDLDKVFTETEAIINEFSRLWKDTYSSMHFIDEDDFTGALQRIADTKHAEVDRYEAEFKEPCPFPRPQMPRSKR
jgi:hypothetical protein